MTTFQAPSVDLTSYPIPVQAFIDGKFVDSTGNDKHTLISSLNDDVVAAGMLSVTVTAGHHMSCPDVNAYRQLF